MRNLVMLTIVAATPLLAQQPAVKSAPVETTPIAITLTVPAQPRGVFPDFVTITLTNTGSEPLRLPMPDMGSADLEHGSVNLEVNGEEAKDSSVAAAAETKWKTLAAGDSLNFAERLSAATDTSRPGEYVLRAIYIPPAVNGEKAEQMYRDSQAYPRETVESASITLRREEGQTTVTLRPNAGCCSAGAVRAKATAWNYPAPTSAGCGKQQQPVALKTGDLAAATQHATHAHATRSP